MTISREALLTPLKVRREKVDLPEFGPDSYVWVHGMTAREKVEHDAWMMNAKWDGVDKSKFSKQKDRMIAFCVRDDDGNRLLSFDDIEQLGQWPADLSNRLFDVANRLSGGATDAAALAKNSSETTDG